MTAPARSRIRVAGIVQGVGFRPFVHALAAEFGLAGFVGNDETGVLIEAEGPPAALAGFVAALRERPPALAVVTDVAVAALPAVGDAAFTIAASTARGPRTTLISPDTATCADCLAELFDPADRRYRYPFTNCTNCGPRFTIVTGVPYDRPLTTMAPFPMCADCAREYADPTDRRFHAQPVCCPACGPRLRFTWTDRESPSAVARLAGFPGGHRSRGRASPDDRVSTGRVARVDSRSPETLDPIAEAAAALRAGAVVAVKGIGGYHVAVLAADEAAVGTLRARKHREDKPFAVLAPDLAAARALAGIDPVEEEALTSRRAPIVLLRRRPDAHLAGSVAPGNRHLGVMLPYTPLHHLLAAEVGAPIVLTSGNLSDEPIAYRDADRLSPLTDALLDHDRAIHTRADDSVVRVERGRVLPIRRARGYAPEPLALAAPVRRPVLGCGAELKSTFCLARGPHAFLSHHIGDLENAETLRSFTEGVAHYRRLFDVEPTVVAHDLHPEYLSTKYAHELGQDCAGVELVGVQHHHAHLASCLADNGEAGPVVGLACDGLGYGTDGALWGGEVMAVSLTGFERLAHLEEVPLPGGATAIRQPWRTAAAWLRAAGIDGADLPVARRNPGWTTVGRLLDSQVAMPVTTSVGRLFDAVAALVGVRDAVNYEGQAAIELEQAADESAMRWYPRSRESAAPAYPSPRESVRNGERMSRSGQSGGYPARVEGGLLYGSDLVRGVVADLRGGVEVPVIATRFHAGLAGLLARAAAGACAATGLDTVALSGGVFQNVLLLRLLVAELETAGLRVLTHSRVPPNDAGVSLGQVAVAAAMDGN
jgi:hydrogenase maturation protein HypF